LRGLIRTGWGDYLELTYGEEAANADASAANDTDMLVVDDDEVEARQGPSNIILIIPIYYHHLNYIICNVPIICKWF
jgi:hypothetical protein